MPLIYQGPLTQRVFKRPIDAYQHGASMLNELALGQRLDLRLAWDRPQVMFQTAERFGDDFSGCWLDVAAAPTDGVLDKLVEWATRLEGGQLSVVCLKKGFEAEVSISCPVWELSV